MSEDNSTQPQEDKLISQAKKRLLGACVILIILLIAAPFVLKNRNEEGPTEPIKITMESSPVANEKTIDSIKPPDPKHEATEVAPSHDKKDLMPSNEPKIKSEVAVLTSSGLYIQLGIFSDNKKIKSYQQKINQLGLQTKIETIRINGIDKLRLITEEFKTEALARDAMLKIKNAGLIAVIKKIS